MAVCKVCFRHCNIGEGALGFCGARICREGEVTADNYGRITSLALDPIEKKPLNRFHPEVWWFPWEATAAISDVLSARTVRYPGPVRL